MKRNEIKGTIDRPGESRRRDFLRLAARYGYSAALVAWVGLPLASFAEKAAAAEASAADEAAHEGEHSV